MLHWVSLTQRAYIKSPQPQPHHSCMTFPPTILWQSLRQEILLSRKYLPNLRHIVCFSRDWSQHINVNVVNLTASFVFLSFLRSRRNVWEDINLSQCLRTFAREYSNLKVVHVKIPKEYNTNLKIYLFSILRVRYYYGKSFLFKKYEFFTFTLP